MASREQKEIWARQLAGHKAREGLDGVSPTGADLEFHRIMRKYDNPPNPNYSVCPCCGCVRSRCWC